MKMEKYEQISVVGEGSYGLVIKCRHKETDQIVAVKKFLETEEDPTIRKLALREIRMLKRLKHENLVTMIEVFRHRKRFYIVFEFMEGTVLDELEKMPGGLGEERTRERIFQVCRAINYCHTNHIIHRDVKPENVLVSSLGVVKLCDFGFARIISVNGEACTEYVATRWYRAPELLVGEPIYGPPVDIWAIGCLFAEMLTGDPLFPGESDIDQLFLIVRALGKPCNRHQHLMSKNTQLRAMIKTPSQETLGFYNIFQSLPLISIEFLTSCTKMDPQERFTAEELLKHTYFLHDKFPQKFLPALREKVCIEFNAPLLRKVKSDVIISTDKREEIKVRKFSNDAKWRFNLNEGTVKRKYSSEIVEPFSDKNLISLSNTSQRLNVLNNSNSKINYPILSKSNIIRPSILHQTKQHVKLPVSNDLQILEKTTDNVQRINNNNKNKGDENHRPISDHTKDQSSPNNILPESPTFNTFHFGIGDHSSKSPNFHNILHPNISNISFNSKALPKKSPNDLHHKVPHLTHPRTNFLKKMERNVAIENILFGHGDHLINNNSNNNNHPAWLNNNFSTNRKRDFLNKTKIDDFSLPNLPGATINSSEKNKKKMSIPELELPDSTEVSPRFPSATSQPSPSIKNQLF